MNNELMRYAAGEEVVPYRDRHVAKKAKTTFDRVRHAALEADGVIALGGHIMEGLVVLDQRRQALSQGDPITDMMLADIEANTIRGVKAVQNNVYSGRW